MGILSKRMTHYNKIEYSSSSLESVKDGSINSLRRIKNNSKKDQDFNLGYENDSRLIEIE